ncbi:hypothetical protein [Nocardiopsis sp. FR26]|uniref:deazapurine DNA modification protein DpdA family protein n=1 Tax=Nocardiopsis sp. FR26 TaxID=2605987 RepID=UPI0019155892|nr:hypothetical protein [Nocardiopsis sp. FR26]
MRFYLGTHQPDWLHHLNHRWFEADQVPLFVSHRRLADRRTLFPANVPWALDSGGFTELSMYGRWVTTPTDYAHHVRRYMDEIGRLEWAAPQDWMCEPVMLAKTGLTVAHHQARTLDNLLELRHLAPDLPWVPVLQGWEPDDYRRHADAYQSAGVDLTTEPVVGLGSVCRRQSTTAVHSLVAELAAAGLRLHGFGFKTLGLRKVGHLLASADSLAWSLNARRRPAMAECFDAHEHCGNCPRFATRWRRQLLDSLTPPPAPSAYAA